MISNDDDMSLLQHIKERFELLRDEDYNGHDAILAKILNIESVTFEPTKDNPHNSRSVFSFTVPPELCNKGGSLHGGAVALIFDITTSLAIAPCGREDFWDTGHVSRTRIEGNRAMGAMPVEEKNGDVSIVDVLTYHV